MIYDLRHRTTYKYESPVTYARCVLRLSPPTDAEQTVLKSAVTVTPTPSHKLERVGAFGERTLTVVIDKPHRALVVEAKSKIDVHRRPVAAPQDSPPWEAIREESFGTAGLGPDEPAVYLYPSSRAPLAQPLTDYARDCFPPGRPVVEAAAALMTRIRSDFKYDPKATEVSTPTLEAFNARHGVCQDFAHIMISGLRGLGLPAAYVSGYIRTIPPPGRPRLQGADATHAWVSLWCGAERGWIGFDPTNAILAGDDHIVLAVGRDYTDIAPIDGVILAPGAQTLKVEVDVIPEGETVEAAPPVRKRAVSRRRA